jgi:magnesium and cobalt exporter, CNNM family
VEDINERMKIGLPLNESYETLGGLIIDRLGHIPLHPGEKVEINDGTITLVVMQMHGRRIVKVKIIIHPSLGTDNR